VGRGEGGLTVAPTTTQAAAPAPRRRRRIDLSTPALLSAPVAWLTLFFLAPVVYVALYSFNVLALPPQATGFTLSAWHTLIHGGVYLSLFWKSVQMALIVSALVVAGAYPLAYYLALSGTPRKYVLLLVLIAPFMTSYLLRVLAWKVILGNGGINSFLAWTGLTSHPLSFLLYSRFAVMLVLGYVWLPFVALPIFVTLESLDRGLLEAASDLGATRFQAFLRVTLPLSMPGVVAAFLFVFIPTVGEFVTPSLVGGSGGYMYGNLIQSVFNSGFPDWQTGATLSLFLLAVIAALTLVFVRFLRVTEAPAT
jgi:spermidine/putrescine transport system permease protein